MSFVQRSLASETFRTILMALILIGVLAVIAALVIYVQAQNSLTEVANASQALGEQMAALDNEQQAQDLGAMPVALAQERNQARRQQTQSFFVGGAGLIALGVGWFGYDLVKRRRKI